MGRPEEPDWHGPFWHLIRSGILDMEPPDHTRVRALVSKAFTPRMVEGMRQPIQQMMDALIDEVAGAGEFDLIATLAEPLPVAVIAELLGVPEDDRHLLRPWSADICGMYELRPSEETARTAVRASVEFSEYLRTLSRLRRAEPQDDLISALAQVVDEGERLTEDELIGTCVLLLNAGHEATVNVTGNGWWSLFRNPEQLAALREDVTLVPRAIEELMRWDTPLQMFERWVLEDAETLRRPGPEGRRAGVAVRLREPRSGRVRPSGRSRRGTRAEPARVVRRRRPFLPGRAARAPGAPDVVRDGPAPDPRAAARAGADRGNRTTSSEDCRAPRRRVKRPRVAAWESRRSDSNRRPSDYKSLALPDCATPAGSGESTRVCPRNAARCENERRDDEHVDDQRDARPERSR